MNKRTAIILFSASMFFTGASGLVNEYILSTVSSYLLGNSIEKFSITIAIMMGFMGFGGFVQKYISDKNLIFKFFILESILAVLSAFAPLAIYSAYAMLPGFYSLVYFFFVASIGFMIGFEIPFIIRINEKYMPELKGNLSVIMAADYIGSLVGAFAWVYLLLPHFNILKIGFIIASINFIVAIITVLYLTRNRNNLLVSIVVMALLTVGFLSINKVNLFIEQKLYKDPILKMKNTKYQHIVLTKNFMNNDIRLYLNGNTQFSSMDEKIYHENLVHPAMSLAKRHEKVLILGGGDGMVMRELDKYENIEYKTLVDLDKGMTDFSRENEAMKKLNKGSFEDAIYVPKEKVLSKKKTITNDDADIALKQFVDDGKKWDVIIADFPDPRSVELAKLYSVQFYRKIKKILSKGGIFVVQSSSPFFSKNVYLTIGKSLEAAGLNVLPYHDNVHSFGEWGWWIAWNPEDMSKEEMLNRISEMDFKVETEYLTPIKFKANMVFSKNYFNDMKNATVNTLLHPVIKDLYERNIWDQDTKTMVN